MLSKEFLSKSFSKNTEALKCSVNRTYSHSPEEVINPGVNQKALGYCDTRMKKNGGETMTLDNIIRQTDNKGVPKLLFTLKREGVTKLFESFKYESPYFLDKC